LDPFVCGIASIAQQNWNVAPCMSNAVKGQDQVDSMKSGHENDAPNLSGKWLTAYVVSQQRIAVTHSGASWLSHAFWSLMQRVCNKGWNKKDNISQYCLNWQRLSLTGVRDSHLATL